MDWFVKHWDELTRDELYDLLAVRTAVFVVEQRCPYQEADGLDRRAWHVFARDGGRGTAQIGRVLTVDRGTGLGRVLMERGIRAAWEKTGARHIRLEAQSHAQGFYEKLGFRLTEAPEFLEDGIPHVEMVLERKQ